jgi:hypothetical protein
VGQVPLEQCTQRHYLVSKLLLQAASQYRIHGRTRLIWRIYAKQELSGTFSSGLRQGKADEASDALRWVKNELLKPEAAHTSVPMNNLKFRLEVRPNT